jgi:hypothetical protein
LPCLVLAPSLTSHHPHLCVMLCRLHSHVTILFVCCLASNTFICPKLNGLLWSWTNFELFPPTFICSSQTHQIFFFCSLDLLSEVKNIKKNSDCRIRIFFLIFICVLFMFFLKNLVFYVKLCHMPL